MTLYFHLPWSAIVIVAGYAILETNQTALPHWVGYLLYLLGIGMAIYIIQRVMSGKDEPPYDPTIQ